MTRIVINKCYGGFGLSHEAIMRYAELKGFENFRHETDETNEYSFTYYAIGKEPFYDDHIERDDPILIQVVEELGEKSWGQYSELKIVEIPDKISWEIGEYDGSEWVAEKHQTWF